MAIVPLRPSRKEPPRVLDVSMFGAPEGRPSTARAEAPPRRERALSAQQFVNQLEALVEKKTRAQILAKVENAREDEIRGLVETSAALKGRYFAQLLDMQSQDKPPTAQEVSALRGLRLAFEEIDQGVDAIKDAIRTGLLIVQGVRYED